MTARRRRRLGATELMWDRVVGTLASAGRAHPSRAFMVAGLLIVVTVSVLVPIVRSRPDAVAATTPAADPATAVAAAAATTGASAMPTNSASTGYVLADPPVTGVTPSRARPPSKFHHEFQANCSVTRDLKDDPIVLPGLPGASHMHTFSGNTSTDAYTTLTSLDAGATSCRGRADRSAYWMPTVYRGDQIVDPVGPQIVYYKSGVNDYTSVREFPVGLRFVAGSPTATPEQFIAVSPQGWECGKVTDKPDFPTTCPEGDEFVVRYIAPSCWDGKYLDTPDHKSHMAYPVSGVCPDDHPVAVAKLEFKMAYPASGDLTQYKLSSGRGNSFHFDFFNRWDQPTLRTLVKHCINGGLQCDSRGFSKLQAQAGAALDEQYELPGSHTVISRAGWTGTASLNSAAVAKMLDGNRDTRWSTAKPMANGQSVTIDMHATNTVKLITIDAADSFRDYARGYQIFLSTDGSTWGEPVASGTGYVDLISASFAPRSARYIKIVQTGSNSSWWSIAELVASS